MKLKRLVGLSLCVFAISPTVFGQEEKSRREAFEAKAREMRQRGGEGGPSMGQFMQNIPVLAALDADKDGSLSASEIANASKAILTLDKNGDGVVSMEEMRPAFNPMAAGGRPGEGGGPGPEMMKRMFTEQDKNGDGKLTGDEIPERMRERVAQIDENGDGAIDSSEMQRVMARMAGGRPGDRPGQGGKDGSGIRPKRPGQDN